ncbi:MAG: hypothetical protein CFE26_10580 [Verrucomicrobiales bacterium VVV1]|nr:MAG: hypothetical protein CFE26_10580 [Verrucomicrobiales bacterium VVV1]
MESNHHPRLPRQKHIGNKKQCRDLANQFKDEKNPLKIVNVRDMWLTGFGAPWLHTMHAG